MGRRRRTLYLMTVFRWILSLRVEEAKGFVWTQRSRLRRIPTRCRNTLSSVQLASSSSSCSCSCPQHVVLAQCHWKSRTTLSRQRTLHGRRRNNAHRCFSSYNEQDDQDPVLRSLKESFRDCILPHIPTTNNNNDDDDDDDNTMLPVVLGVSGGCDSVGLFHALVEVLEKEEGEDGQWRLSSSCGERAVPIDLHVVHFDHRQRGSESDGDRIFVQNLCNDFRIPCHVYYWEENEHQAASFSQETARAWRRTTMYALLSSLTSSSSSPTRTTGTGVLLTAHHRDDSAETMLLKLLRGVHLTNIAGMEQAIAFPNDMPRAVVARPLLRVSKAQIQDFLTTRGLEWREDSSNASNKYKRNRVRNELIPLLSDIVGDEATLLVSPHRHCSCNSYIMHQSCPVSLCVQNIPCFHVVETIRNAVATEFGAKGLFGWESFCVRERVGDNERAVCVAIEWNARHCPKESAARVVCRKDGGTHRVVPFIAEGVPPATRLSRSFAVESQRR